MAGPARWTRAKAAWRSFRARYRSNLANPRRATPEQRLAHARVALAVFVPLELVYVALGTFGGQLFGWILAAGFAPTVWLYAGVIRRDRREQRAKQKFP